MWKMMASTSALQRQLLLWGILDLGIWQILSLTSLPVSRSGSFVRLLSELLSKPLSSADGPNHWLPWSGYQIHICCPPPVIITPIIAINDLKTFNLAQTFTLIRTPMFFVNTIIFVPCPLLRYLHHNRLYHYHWPGLSALLGTLAPSRHPGFGLALSCFAAVTNPQPAPISEPARPSTISFIHMQYPIHDQPWHP